MRADIFSRTERAYDEPRLISQQRIAPSDNPFFIGLSQNRVLNVGQVCGDDIVEFCSEGLSSFDREAFFDPVLS
jgi:hypothetical protein